MIQLQYAYVYDYILYMCVCVFKVLRMLDDCVKVFLIGAMWNNTVKYLRFEVFKTRYILNSTPSLISWSVNYVFNILKFNKKLVNPLPRHCILYILCYIYVYLMSRLKLCVCVYVVLWGDELEYVWLGYWQQISACFFLSLSVSFSFLLILLMTVLMCILLFFIEIVYCLWHLSVNDHTGKQYAALTQPQPIRNIKTI